MFDSTTKRLLRESVQLLPPDPARSFYDRLFEIAPEVRPLFKSDLDEQKRKLVEMIVWIIDRLDQPDVLLEALHTLGAKHVQYGVKIDDYASVGSALIWMFQQALGPRFSPEMEEAWITAYAAMSREMENA